MGWNDSRATVLAPGWGIVEEEARTRARTADGTPLRVLRVEQLLDRETTNLQPAGVAAWLEEYGFEITERSPHGDVLRWQDVEAMLIVKEGELAAIVLTFTLTRDSPCRWTIWRSMVEQLCEAWDLSLHKPVDGFAVDAGEILHVLADTQAWRDFEVSFQWPAITS